MSRVPTIQLSDLEPLPGVVALVPRQVAMRTSCVPVHRNGDVLVVAMADPSNIYARDHLAFVTGLHVEVVRTTEANIREALDRWYSGEDEAFEDSSEELDTGWIEHADDQKKYDDQFEYVDLAAEYAEEAEETEDPLIRLYRVLLSEAVGEGATRVTFDGRDEDGNAEFVVSFTIDGEEREYMWPPPRIIYLMFRRAQFLAGVLFEDLPEGSGHVFDDSGDRIDFHFTLIESTRTHRRWTLDLV